MGFWIFMLAMDLLIPLSMMGLGRLFLNKAPKEINALFGYRTAMSMKNMDTWKFAHAYCGKLWWIIGLVMLPVSVIALFFTMGKDSDTIGTVGGMIGLVQIIPLIGSIFPTEAALKRTFDRNGKRK